MAAVSTITLSPSGKYCLEIMSSVCKISRDDDKTHAITTFPFKVPFHYNFLQQGEKEYFITSQSSNGMTIIDCETGQQWSHEPEEMDDWCHEWMLVPKSNILILKTFDPYDTYVFWSFYDFDLSKFDEGLPELEDLSPNELDDAGSFTIQQGRDIPIEMLNGVKVEPDEYYPVFTRGIEENIIKLLQDDLYFEPKDWLPLFSKEEQGKIADFIKKWENQDTFILRSFSEFSEEKKKLIDDLSSSLDKGVVKINLQEAILHRQDDKIVFLVYRNRNGETGIME